MSDFKAKMHQNRFRLGLHPMIPDPAGGAHSSPPYPLAAFKGLTDKGRGMGGKEGRRKGGWEWVGRDSFVLVGSVFLRYAWFCLILVFTQSQLFGVPFRLLLTQRFFHW